MHDNQKQYCASWKWITEQLARREANMAAYEQKPTANPEYVRREKAFNAATRKFIIETSNRFEFLVAEITRAGSDAAKEINKKDEMIDTLIALLRAYGVTEISETDIGNARTIYKDNIEIGIIKVPQRLQTIIFNDKKETRKAI